MTRTDSEARLARTEATRFKLRVALPSESESPLWVSFRVSGPSLLGRTCVSKLPSASTTVEAPIP
jgi:hypothetical protein